MSKDKTPKTIVCYSTDVTEDINKIEKTLIINPNE